VIEDEDVWMVKELLAARRESHMEFDLVSPTGSEGTLWLEAGRAPSGEARWAGGRWLLNSFSCWTSIATPDGGRVATYREFMNGRLRTTNGEVSWLVPQDFMMLECLWCDDDGGAQMWITAMPTAHGAALEGRINFVSVERRTERAFLLAFVGWFVVGHRKVWQ
jgi:hypothetical protein